MACLFYDFQAKHFDLREIYVNAFYKEFQNLFLTQDAQFYLIKRTKTFDPKSKQSRKVANTNT